MGICCAERIAPKSTRMSNQENHRSMFSVTKIYLLTYNLFQAIGWSIAVCRLFTKFLSTKSLSGAYASTGELICFLQKLAFLEVIHGALGVVPSGFLNPFMQWGGRTHVVMAIVRPIFEVQELPSVFITFAAWSLTEVIRYSHYALSCVGCLPYWIIYLRYTVFIVLYPIGVAPGEMWLMYEALPFIKKRNLYAQIFAHTPFGYYDFVTVLLFFYPLLWLKLYLHMFKQRQSKLRANLKRE